MFIARPPLNALVNQVFNLVQKTNIKSPQNTRFRNLIP
jgi:hypothetical protein